MSAFPEVSKPCLTDGAVAAVGWQSPHDPLPPAICHLPVSHSQGFRGDPEIDLYPSAVSQAHPGAGEALCPSEEQCRCHAVLCHGTGTHRGPKLFLEEGIGVMGLDWLMEKG